jgi:hypothetical protein
MLNVEDEYVLLLFVSIHLIIKLKVVHVHVQNNLLHHCMSMKLCDLIISWPSIGKTNAGETMSIVRLLLLIVVEVEENLLEIEFDLNECKLKMQIIEYFLHLIYFEIQLDVEFVFHHYISQFQLVSF